MAFTLYELSLDMTVSKARLNLRVPLWLKPRPEEGRV